MWGGGGSLLRLLMDMIEERRRSHDVGLMFSVETISISQLIM